eukprot:SAG31_NODE_2966_length_4842_cov_23.744676_2_plen_290_part_00
MLKPQPTMSEASAAGALPYGGDLQAAMRAQDRDAVRVLMARRDQQHAAAAPAAVANHNSPRMETESTAAVLGSPSSAPVAQLAAEPALPDELAQTMGGTLVDVTVKFGRSQFVVPLVLDAGGQGVTGLARQLEALTRVPAAAQTIVGAGGRKWAPTTNLRELGVRCGTKVRTHLSPVVIVSELSVLLSCGPTQITLIGKVPAHWKRLQALESDILQFVPRVEAALATPLPGRVKAIALLADEMTKHLLAIDGLVVENADDNFRAARKAAVVATQEQLDRLENTAVDTVD